MVLSKRQETGYIHCLLTYRSQFCKTEVLKLMKISVGWKIKVTAFFSGDSNQCKMIKWSLILFALMKSKKLQKFCSLKKLKTLPFFLLCFINIQKLSIQDVHRSFYTFAKLLSLCKVGLCKFTYI